MTEKFRLISIKRRLRRDGWTIGYNGSPILERAQTGQREYAERDPLTLREKIITLPSTRYTRIVTSDGEASVPSGAGVVISNGRNIGTIYPRAAALADEK